MTILRWLLALVLAAFFARMGLAKFGEHNAVFQYIAQQSHMAFFEPQVRLMTGAGELAAALLLVLPRTRIAGALLALALLGGALGFHLSPWLGINAPVSFAPDGSYVRSPMLFVMALSFFLAALGVFLVELGVRREAAALTKA